MLRRHIRCLGTPTAVFPLSSHYPAVATSPASTWALADGPHSFSGTATTATPLPLLGLYRPTLLLLAPLQPLLAMESSTAMEGPHDVSVDTVLLPHSSSSSSHHSMMLVELVQLLIDPDATDIENVSLRDFVAMLPRRQLRAVGMSTDIYDAVLQSERYQAEKDRRLLRLAGVQTVGQWKEGEGQVALSPFSRGALEAAYHSLTKSSQQAARDDVLAWLTRTIQRAVAQEVAAPALIASGTTIAAVVESSPSSSVAAATESLEEAPPTDAALHDAAEAEVSKDEEEEVKPVRRRGPRQRPLSATKAAAAAAVPPVVVVEARDDEAVEEEAEEEEVEEVEELVEAEVASSSSSPPLSAKGQSAGSKESARRGKAAVQEEEEGREEEYEAAGDQDGPDHDAESSPNADQKELTLSESRATPTAVAPGAEQETLQRLSALMLKQFNTADGYLHPTTTAEQKELEQRGDVIFIDDSTVQVDPLTLFSAFHAANITTNDPLPLRAIKDVWNRYNQHQLSLEDAATEAEAMFYRHQSVDVLMYGAVLLRALAREERVVLRSAGSLPPYGFPLLSSDTRPYASKMGDHRSSSSSSSRGAAATNMEIQDVIAAVDAYKTLFSEKGSRYSPFLPAIDCNAGCGVVMLSGTTLHLYSTVMSAAIVEEDVRLPFAEVMLGVLHLLRNGVLPRVNVVHYHIIAAQLCSDAADENFLARSAATIDLTQPFTPAERASLKRLAEPLGMGAEVEDFACIEDVVMEIEESSTTSVVHSLMQHRDDLEAMLTATLAQLLPEDGDAAAATGDGAEEAGEPSAAVEAEEDEDHEVEEEHYDAEAEAPPRRRGAKSKRRRARSAEQEPGEEQGEFAEEEVAAPPAARRTPATVPATSKKRTAGAVKAVVHDEMEEEEEERDDANVSAMLQQMQGEFAEMEREEEEEEEEVEEEEEEEEVGRPLPTPATPAAARRPSTASRTRTPPPRQPISRDEHSGNDDEVEGVEHEYEAEEEEEEKMPPARVLVAKSPPRSGGSRRLTARSRASMPTATSPSSHAGAERDGHDDDDGGDRWFNTRPKRRYFE